MKKESVLIGVSLIGISFLFTCLSAISAGESVSVKEQSKKITQLNNENNNGTAIMMDYALIPFSRLIGMADQIVIGSVEEVGDSTFEFHVDESLLNHHDSKSISITKYNPAEIFATRALPYVKGQQFSLFLSKAEQDSAGHPWRIIGIVGEGEMRIEDGFVFFGAYDLKGLEYESVKLHGATRNLQRFNLDDFKDAVRNYHTCFSWKLVEFIKNKKKRSRWIASKTCHDASVKNYQTKSWLHEYLAQETINMIPVKNNE